MAIQSAQTNSSQAFTQLKSCFSHTATKVSLAAATVLFATGAVLAHVLGMGTGALVAFSVAGGLSLVLFTASCIMGLKGSEGSSAISQALRYTGAETIDKVTGSNSEEIAQISLRPATLSIGKRDRPFDVLEITPKNLAQNLTDGAIKAIKGRIYKHSGLPPRVRLNLENIHNEALARRLLLTSERPEHKITYPNVISIRLSPQLQISEDFAFALRDCKPANYNTDEEQGPIITQLEANLSALEESVVRLVKPFMYSIIEL